MTRARERASEDDSLPRVPEASEPTIDLVVATLGDRRAELERLLASLAAQTYRRFRTILVDQSGGDALAAVASPGGLELVHVRSDRGLSRARNAGLALASADLVAFPDDDCLYPPDLLERVARRFAEQPALDVLTGRTADAAGRSSSRWPTAPRTVDLGSVWHAGNSASLFVRLALARRVGGFDEALGLGSGTPWSSGEEIDYLVRALGAGAHVEHEPSLVVVHPLRASGGDALVRLGRRDGGSVGYVLGRHRFPARTVVRMLVRPVGGALVAAASGDVARARFHLATLVGRIAGYRAGRAR